MTPALVDALARRVMASLVDGDALEVAAGHFDDAVEDLRRTIARYSLGRRQDLAGHIILALFASPSIEDVFVGDDYMRRTFDEIAYQVLDAPVPSPSSSFIPPPGGAGPSGAPAEARVWPPARKLPRPN